MSVPGTTIDNRNRSRRFAVNLRNAFRPRDWGEKKRSIQHNLTWRIHSQSVVSQFVSRSVFSLDDGRRGRVLFGPQDLLFENSLIIYWWIRELSCMSVCLCVFATFYSYYSFKFQFQSIQDVRRSCCPFSYQISENKYNFYKRPPPILKRTGLFTFYTGWNYGESIRQPPIQPTADSLVVFDYNVHSCTLSHALTNAHTQFLRFMLGFWFRLGWLMALGWF